VTAVEERPGGASLKPKERRSIVLGTVFRIVGTPLVAVIALANTAIIVQHTGEAVFGLVSLVSTLSLLLPFADLGIGAVVTSACSKGGPIGQDGLAVATVQRAARMLCLVAVGLIGVAAVVMATDSWGPLLGTTSGPDDRFAVTVAVWLIALSIPAGLGLRILIGLDQNPLAVLLTMANAIFTLAITFVLMGADVAPIWYAVSGAGGVLVGNCIATVVALRRSGIGALVFRPPAKQYRSSRLLAGSLWMFVASVGLPLGLQSHRLILSHVSTAAELSRYALMAQVYGLGWMVFSTAGMALWPVFVKRRTDIEASRSLWLKSTAMFFAVALVGGAVLIAAGPWATSLISNGELVASRQVAIAFAALLVVQCFHLPAGMMLTLPHEARWQSLCIVVMGTISVALGIWWGQLWGGAGVVAAAAVAVAAAQILPDLLWIPVLLRRRRTSSDTADTVSAAAPQPQGGRHRRKTDDEGVVVTTPGVARHRKPRPPG
jgi:O-antigen/teichoic acid export membrane protein